MTKKNVFVLGLNDVNKDRLETLPQSNECIFHQLLTYEETHGSSQYDVKSNMESAMKQLDNFKGKIDAIMGFWDFPVSIMQSILSKQYRTRAASIESVYYCENKYESRRKQAEVIPECVPCFEGFSPFDDNALEKIQLKYPFWIKPIKAFGGYLGFKIESKSDFDDAMVKMRQKIEGVTKPFFDLLEYASLPFEPNREILCVAEEIISGHQCTLEGFAHEGEIKMHGVVDSHSFKGMSSFSHYQYPSVLSDEIKKRMHEFTRKVMKHIGFDNSAFNIEFYWDKDTDDIKLLEINPRVSQSHADLFNKVDGVFNQKIVLDTALGTPPNLPIKQGPYNTAGKFFIRHFNSGVVTHAPDDKNIEEVHKKYPGVVLDLEAKKGQKLEDLSYQDSYSYKLGFVYVGGKSDQDMKNKFENVKKILNYEVEDLNNKK